MRASNDFGAFESDKVVVCQNGGVDSPDHSS